MFELAYANEFAHQCYANLVSHGNEMQLPTFCPPFAHFKNDKWN